MKSPMTISKHQILMQTTLSTKYKVSFSAEYDVTQLSQKLSTNSSSDTITKIVPNKFCVASDTDAIVSNDANWPTIVNNLLLNIGASRSSSLPPSKLSTRLCDVSYMQCILSPCTKPFCICESDRAAINAQSHLVIITYSCITH